MNQRTNLALSTMALMYMLSSVAVAQNGGGQVMPPSARPHGFSLTEMARLTAPFTTSSNDPVFYPATPFQILYYKTQMCGPPLPDTVVCTGDNSFSVRPGTMFYVPIFNADDSRPVFGDFPEPPTTSSQVVFYWSDPSQLGFLKETAITVDGQTTPIPTAYLVGPIMAQLEDGTGTHIITLGAFLTPLSTGKHTVTIQAKATGNPIMEFFGGLFEEMFTYTVTVE